MNLNTIRFNILILHTIVISLLLIFNTFYEISNSNFILFTSIWNIIFFILLLYYEFTFAKDFHPFILMLLFSIQYVGLNGIYISNTLMEGKRFLFGIYDITEYLPKGTLYVSLEHLLLYWGFYYYELKYKEFNHNILEDLKNTSNNYNKYYSMAIVSYIVVWILRIINVIIPLRSITSVLFNIASQGQLITIMLFLFAYLKQPFIKYMIFHWGIMSIEILMKLDSGMKEGLIQLLIPFIFFLLLQYMKTKKIINLYIITKMSVIGIFILYFIFPYISLYRQMNWTEKQDASISMVISEYFNYMKGESIYNTNKNRSTDEAISRAGAIEQNTFPIMYSEINGITPKYLYYTIIAFVPRIIWRNKPPIRLGLMIYSLSLGKSNWEEIHTGYGVAFSIGFIGACFFSLGPLYAIIMPFLLGYFISKIWYFYKNRITNNVIAIWAIIDIFAVISKDFEAFSDGGIAFIVWHSIYCTLIIIIEKFKLIKLSSRKMLFN